MQNLPIDTLKPEIIKLYGEGVRKFVVSSPTGSGKSTRLPQMFAEAVEGVVYILQPRRIAARMLAKRVAFESGKKLVEDVGWQIRFEKSYTSKTKIVFLTEGILARKLLSKDGLNGVSAIIFDEFHERNIYSDLSLALALKLQQTSRRDLALAVCSASMDASEILDYMGGGAKLLSCALRTFDLEFAYSPVRNPDAYWLDAQREFARLADETQDGNFLIFMPGSYEIYRTIRAIENAGYAKKFDVLPLHGELSIDMQDKVLEESTKRKVIVCTNIAETSLTVSGVKYVIDSGFARVARYDASRGVNTLLVERISLASATQRAGRAGRTSNGKVVRLWRQADEVGFEKFTSAEILRLSLSQVALWLAASAHDIEEIDFLQNPDKHRVLEAKQTLASLGALDENFKITRFGLKMAKLPTEPRYAKLLVEGLERDCLDEAAMVAALTEVGRIKMDLENHHKQYALDEMLGNVNSELEELVKLSLIARANKFSEDFCRTYGIHSQNARKVCALAEDFVRIASRLDGNDKKSSRGGELEIWRNVAKCVLSAFPEHLCKRINQGTLACEIALNRRGEIRRDSRTYAKDIFCAISLREQNVAGRVSILASLIIPVEAADVKEIFGGEFFEDEREEFDDTHKCINTIKVKSFKSLVLFKDRIETSNFGVAAKMLASDIMSGKLTLKNWDEDVEDYINRINFLARHCPELGFEFIDEDVKLNIFEQMCYGSTSYAQVRDANVKSAFADSLSAEQRASLKYYAPEIVDMPQRKKPLKIRYDIASGRAIISAWFKDLMNFDTSKVLIAGGKIAATYEVLAPNNRPVQTTQDLNKFWKTSWLDISKELKTRYPKHFKTIPEK